MTLRKSKPLPWLPSGCVDAVDGTPRGKDTWPMSVLSNLVPDDSTDHIFVPRVASVNLTEFSGYTTPTGVSGGIVIGDLFYGMLSSGAFSGHDQPFVYNLATNAFLTISGATSANTPATQGTTGDWNPPTMDVIGGRVIVTHPGFAGSPYYFGWFDISGFTTTTTGDIVSTSPTISGFPNIAGVESGMKITGTAIPANTVVLSTANVVLAPTGTTYSNTTVDTISSMTGIAVGQQIEGAGIAAGTTITAVNIAGSSITLSQAATASASGVTLNITGTTITMSANATGTHNAESITIAGGTAAAPLWGAGNTTGYPLPSVPQWVKNFNNRAYYGVANQAWYSDVLVPTNMTNAGQALTVGDTTNLTCAASLPFSSAFGGVAQALVVFKKLGIFQIQGDAALSTLSLQTMTAGVGCNSPRSLANTTEGLAFVSNRGLRFVTLLGTISPVVGEKGSGIALPFINALYPTRIASAYNSDTLRISVQNGIAPETPWQDWWFYLPKKIWTGPHTFPSVLTQPWENTFVIVPQSELAGLWQSDPSPVGNDGYTENGTALFWDWETVPLPDTGAMMENAVIESSIGLGFYSAAAAISVSALDDNGNTITQASLSGGGDPAVWDSFTWGDANWLGGYTPYQQMMIPWPEPLVANQFSISAMGLSEAGFRIGSLFLRYQELGYMIQT